MIKKVEMEIVVPVVPNFLRTVTMGNQRANLVPIEQFDEKELREIGDEWTRELIKLAKKLKKKATSPS